MSSVNANLMAGNSCRQGLSANPDPSQKNYLMDTPAEVSKVDSSVLSGMFRYYATVTIRMYDGQQIPALELPSGNFNGKKVVVEVYSSGSVSITGLSPSVSLSRPSTKQFTNDGKQWVASDTPKDYAYNPNCSGVLAAPVNLDGWNGENMSARFIAFTRGAL